MIGTIQRERIIAIKINRAQKQLILRTFKGRVVIADQPGLFDDGQWRQPMTPTETKAALDAQAPTPPKLRPLADILADLKKPPASKHLRYKRKGGTDLEFIPWYFVIQYLDLYAPGWCYEIRSVSDLKGHHLRPRNAAEIKAAGGPGIHEEISPQVVLTVRLTIHTSDYGPVWREASGIEDDETNSYGDASSNAESMALRRAAAKFGFGLYLYDRK